MWRCPLILARFNLPFVLNYRTIVPFDPFLRAQEPFRRHTVLVQSINRDRCLMGGRAQWPRFRYICWRFVQPQTHRCPFACRCYPRELARGVCIGGVENDMYWQEMTHHVVHMHVPAPVPVHWAAQGTPPDQAVPVVVCILLAAHSCLLRESHRRARGAWDWFRV